MVQWTGMTWEDKLPSEDLDISEENVTEFFRTMYERQEIWYKRFLKQPQPWTEDKFLLEHKFTNVYRELDRQSQYLISQILLKYDGDTIDLLIYRIVFFKYFNNLDFFEFLKTTEYGGIPEPEDYKADLFLDILTRARTAGLNPYTNAYLTNSQACPGMTRDQCFATKVIPNLVAKYKEIPTYFDKTPKDLIKFLNSFPSVSDFLSHEFYQDFTYITRYTKFKFPFTQDDYTNVGPGCSVGLRILFPSTAPRDQEPLIGLLRDISEERLKEFGDFKYVHWDKENKKYIVNNTWNLTLHNVEFWECEFQKYFKMIIGQGKQRSKIKPGRENKDYSFYMY